MSFQVEIPSGLQYVSHEVKCTGDGLFLSESALKQSAAYQALGGDTSGLSLPLVQYNSGAVRFDGTATASVAGITKTSWEVMTLTCKATSTVSNPKLTLSGVSVYHTDTSGNATELSVTVENSYSVDKDALSKGWNQVNSKWYYVGSDGSLATGWKKLSGSWYYFGTDGAMRTGWQQVDGSWYYMKSGGAAVAGWYQLGSKWYYFDLQSFIMRQNAWLSAGGNWYYFDDTGAMITGWKQVGGTWFYFASSGAMTTGWKQVGGKWYYFDLKSGAMRQSAWLSTTNGNWYYFDSSGVMLASTTRKIDGKTYTFDASGRML
jgi:glucan-binding YG repeat protein